MTTITTTSLGELLRSEVPAIAVSFADQVPDKDLEQARADGLDVYELRIDRYTSFDVEHVLGQVRRYEGVPTIATIRTDDEGGLWRGSDEDRLALFEAIMPHVQGIDIELQSMDILPKVVQAAKTHGKVVIISNHNFDATPPTDAFVEMAHQAKELGADFVKLSAMANSIEDLRVLTSFTLEYAELGLIVIAMGEHGMASRIFFPALGSRLTYAYSQAWPVSGQLTYEDTLDALMTFYPAFREKKVVELKTLSGGA